MNLIIKKMYKRNQENLSFQVATCFIEYNEEILALRRGRKDSQYGLWGIPGGKMESKEDPRQALSREIFEETQIFIPADSFLFLDKAISKNKFDGTYGLYLYYFKLISKEAIVINNQEHLDYRWVSLKEFEKMNLLASQGLAYSFIKKKLHKIIRSQKNEQRT